MNDIIDIIDTPSLIPYLKTDGTKFHIKIWVGDPDDSIHQKSSLPFWVVSESGPFARIIEARIKTDAGTNIEPVFLLIQKDEPPLSRDELWPLDNRAVDRYWQNTLTFYSREKSGSPPLILKDQMDKNGALLPFQPLLYCKFNQTYFPPLCPDCGTVLQQCYNDNMLQGYGLLPYSKSLKRYLFCPSCTGSKEKIDFYVSSLDDNDPAFLKDRYELIKKFGQLNGNGNENFAGQFPCVNCSRHQECYGPDGLAVSRIVPLSFYPFYMLMFKAGSVNGFDFLSLISGASFKEIEDRLKEKQQPGRLNCLKVLKQKPSVHTSFFFKNEDRYFLEVLYLKLSFLGELIEAVFSGLDTFQYPDLGLSMDRIWVNLSDQNSLLPCFWNFKVALLDVIGSDVPSSSIPQMPRSYGFHLLGFVWFYTLLVNRKQDVSQIYPVLGEVMEKIKTQDDANFENYLEAGFLQVLSPENIFFNPDILSVKQDWHKFWKASLGLGFHFFEVSMLGSRDGSIEEFGHELEQLRQEIKDSLFSTEPSVPDEESEADDKIISNILKKIMNTRQEEDETSSDDLEISHILPEIDDTTDDKTAPDFQEDSDVFQTVILSSDDKLTEKLTGIEQKEEPGEAPPVPENDLDETLILTPEGLETPGTADTPDHYDEDMEDTVIFSPDGLGQNVPLPSPPEEDDLPETVIISSEQGSSGCPPEVPPGPSRQDFGSEGIIKGGSVPDEMTTGEHKKAETSEPDEFLEETLLILPGKSFSGEKDDNK
ncbi:MAG: hypothetical protein SRB2_03900 [Desulfobacteraceae bacterium Eth-SRB2]|nr:MAG: hypothetical protein SRB2_03900 [Desulfobacteraceae bacterium Eth-SRB2]